MNSLLNDLERTDRKDCLPCIIGVEVTTDKRRGEFPVTAGTMWRKVMGEKAIEK